MMFLSSVLPQGPARRSFFLLLPGSVALAAAFIAGCGGGGGTTFSGSTPVTILTTSTANDRLPYFTLYVTAITLTGKKGKLVTLLDAPQYIEFAHQNGAVEPLVTASVPVGIYTSATVTANYGNIVCTTLSSGGGVATYGEIGVQASAATVNLPAPISVTGSGMGLTLNLQVPQSVSPLTCGNDLLSAVITPTFTLTPVTFAAQPANSANGKASGLRGLIGTAAAGETGFSVVGDLGAGMSAPTWQVTTNGSTVFQGITGASQLAAGMPVDMDVALQKDGSLLATRVAVYDTNPANLTFSDGPIMQVVASQPTMLAFATEHQGPLLAGLDGGAIPFNVGNTVFQVSGQLANLGSLPFNATFSGANMVPGQNVFVTTHATSFTGGPAYAPATTMTLLPQTIDGTVTAVSNVGGFTAYTVALASYDFFPNLAVQAGQNSLLTNPGEITVYVDSHTQLLNNSSIAAGSVLRFNGLVFNDHGTLRMDCAEVNDGVTE